MWEPPQMMWDEVEAAARSAFRVWDSRRELAWAEEAWDHLADAGLTAYATDLERHRVLIRFLVLPRFYLDWSSKAYNHSEGDMLTDWVETLDLSPFRLGQLVGSGDDNTDWRDDSPLVHSALQSLTYDARGEVVGALKAGFGGDNGLFLSLWRIRYPAPKSPKSRVESAQVSLFPEASDEVQDQDVEDGEDTPEGDEHFSEDDWAVLNNPTVDKLCGYEWVVSDCLSAR